jgi:hypothetical protein
LRRRLLRSLLGKTLRFALADMKALRLWPEGFFFSSCIPANSKKDRRARLGARSIRFLRGFSSAAINGGSVPETDAKTLLPFRAEGPPALPHRHGVRPEEKGRPCDFGTNVPLSALPH